MKETGSKAERATIPSREEMSAAVMNRDAGYDGVFYYGVLTTGVYCRPSCKSRRPREENLRFFAGTDEAEAAGFRACKRCRPEQLEQEVEQLASLARYIQEHADEKLPLSRLASVSGMSASRLQKAFKNALGVTPKQFQDAARLGHLKDALKQGDQVTGAIFSAGFGSTSRVYGEAARSLGMTPAAYRAGGEGERIRYACRETALGPLLMAATERGVCFAQFGDSEKALLKQLREEFPAAEIEPSPATGQQSLDAWMRSLDAYLSASAPRPDLPLDLRGTAFQLKVWRFLLGIREGDVVSYSEVAEGIGKPSAVRAAASACGANRVGVLVPCHRVLRGDGQLGGYRWGVERKRSLLDLERRNRSADR